MNSRVERSGKVFWTRVDKRGPLPDQSLSHYAGLSRCWMWTGFRNSEGYGHATVAKRMMLAHRASWLFTYGEPLPRFVCHRCDNPGCVNPKHLFAGDPLTNTRDCVAKGRNPFPGRNRHLSDAVIARVLALRLQGFSGVHTARLLGVKYAHISRIYTGKLRPKNC